MCAGPDSIYTGVEGVCVQALRVYTLGGGSMCAGPECIYTGVEGVCVQALIVYTLG